MKIAIIDQSVNTVFLEVVNINEVTKSFKAEFGADSFDISEAIEFHLGEKYHLSNCSWGEYEEVIDNT